MIRFLLEELSDIEGFIAAALVDLEDGQLLATYGDEHFNLQVAASGNTEVVHSKLDVIRALHLDDNIEDILITVTGQYHLIRLLESSHDLFLYLVLDSSVANLALARHVLKRVEQDIVDF